MNESGNGSANVGGPDASPEVTVQRIFVKDLSFESPNAPAIFTDSLEPDVNLNLKTTNTALGEDAFEVILHITVHAKTQDRSMFLAELQQAGIFRVRGFDDETRDKVLGAFCPNTLFPYAREAISATVAKGGFPPLTLQPVNFDAMYARSQAQTDGAQS